MPERSAAPIEPLFPGGKAKALVMSYDDGSAHDRRLVEIFNRYRIRATFHLNSAKLGQEHHISPVEVRTLYQGHEVSCHTVSHPDLTTLPDEDIEREVLQDRETLQNILGGPVRGLAYPFGRYNDRVVSLLPKLGIEYARTAESTHDFSVPEDLLRWGTTCHHSLAIETGRRFLGGHEGHMQLMQVWGHSYELDGFMTADSSKNWQYMEDFCRLMQGHDSVHYATTIEIVHYLKALARLRLAPATSVLTNASELTVWIRAGGIPVALEPGESISLAG